MGYSGQDFYCDMALNGKVKLDIVFEDDAVLAFHHTKPFWPVHIVVIPKRHTPSLTDLDGYSDSALLHLIHVVRKIAAQIEQQYGCARVLTNLGDYQDSKHLHFHVNSGEPAKT